MTKARHYLLAYDICDPRRLSNVAKVMEDHGIRVQKSIFESALTDLDVKMLRLKLLQILDLEKDGVKFYPLCQRCSERIAILGEGSSPDLFDKIVII